MSSLTSSLLVHAVGVFSNRTHHYSKIVADLPWFLELKHRPNVQISKKTNVSGKYFITSFSTRHILSPSTSIFHFYLLSPLSVRRPSVNFSHFNQLLWSHWTNLNQTLVEWSLDGPLPNFCPMIPTSNQDGCQAKIEKGGMKLKKNLLLWNYWANLNQTLLKWSLDGPLPKSCPAFQTSDQDGRHSQT